MSYRQSINNSDWLLNFYLLIRNMSQGKRVIIGSRQRINASDINTKQAAQSLIPYVHNGFTHFDTADHYADGEDILGQLKDVLSESDKQIYVWTKRVPHAGPLQEWEVLSAVQKSLERLRIEQLDLLQFHDRDPVEIYGIQRLHELNRLRWVWLIKNLGLTNASADYVEKVVTAGIPLVSNQICYSLLAQRPSSRMTQVCQANNIEILAFGTVAWGFLSEKRLGKAEPLIDDLSNASLKKYKRFIDVTGGRDRFQSLLETLDVIAKQHNVSIATVASNYILQQAAVGAVIVGARLGESEHITENKKILSLELTQENKKQIQQVLDTATPLPGDFGDEYRLDHSEYPGWHESLTSTGKSGYLWHQNKYIK